MLCPGLQVYQKYPFPTLNIIDFFSQYDLTFSSLKKFMLDYIKKKPQISGFSYLFTNTTVNNAFAVSIRYELKLQLELVQQCNNMHQSGI